ncbi:unnamed protein product [Rotaria sp. Silwood2]|nr:unnamed protein product [Rotaria sp. Silwood2]
MQSFTDNITECNTLQTESRIEITPNNNNARKLLNRKLINNNNNTEHVDNIDEFVSPIETLICSTSRRDYLSSTILQREQSFSSTSQNEQFSSLMSELEPVSSSFSRNLSSQISSSIQCNVTFENSQANDDFVAELPSSYQFKLQPVDLAKLLVIRSKKINKKMTRLYKEMGLSDVTDDTTTSKKIFISKKNKSVKSTINKTAGTEGNICQY